MISLRLNEEIENRLYHLAKTTGRTKSYYIRKLIEENLNDLEDKYIAEQRLGNTAKRLTSKEMRQRLNFYL